LGRGKPIGHLGETPVTALRIIDAYKSFGRIPIIRGVSLEIIAGERHAIIGPNGAGKSTLFNLISGRVPLTSGRVELAGRAISGLSPHAICRAGLSRSFQITNIFPQLSAYENIRCAVLWTFRRGYTFWRSLDGLTNVCGRAEAVLDEIGLAARRDAAAGTLSYAEQRALEIGITVAGDPRVLLLDEPTAGMSRSETKQTIELIERVSQTRTLLMIEHDMSVVFGLADRISVVVYGQVIATGTPESIKSNEAVREAYLGSLA
jgi:branched-chain amino acid transport system ATP-binding protein